MLRWAFNIVAELSLVLLIATVVLWVRSFSVADQWRRSVDGSLNTVVSLDWGSIRMVDFPPGLIPLSGGYEALEASPPDTDLSDFEVQVNLLGIVYAKEPAPDVPLKIVRIPLWLIAAVLAVLPTCWLVTWPRHRRRVRRRRGQCERCGYDLRGSAGACPECGCKGRART